MEEIFNQILQQYEIFLLVFVRVTGIFVIAPVFSRNNIPNIMKIGFAFLISILIFNFVEVKNVSFSEYQLIGLIIKELIIGILIGFVAYLFFSALYVAGQLIDMQVGFGMVNVFDPQQKTQVPITGNFLYIIAILIFLITNQHHILIKAVASSYKIVPIGTFILNNLLIDQMINVFTEIFVIGFKISSPILATIFLTNVLLGILARTMPQMNVFMLGMPLKIVVGIVTLIVMMPLFVSIFQYIFDNMYKEIFILLKVIGNG